MKNFLSLFATAFLLSGTLFLTSCGEDDTGGGGGTMDVDPDLSISNETATTVDASGTVTFMVDVTRGTNELDVLTITEDGVNMSEDRISIAEFVTAGITFTNPYTLTGSDRTNNITYTVTITVPDENSDPTMPEDYFYNVSIADNKGASDDADLTVTVNPSVEPGTPIEEELSAKLLTNQANSSPVGALDLREGKQSGVNSDGEVDRTETEIRDMGLDCTVPAPGFNWRRQIATTNGADMRQVNLTVVEGFTFAAVTTKEEIVGAYDTGISFSDGEVTNCANGSTSPAENVSDVVTEGDMFVVLGSDGTYYLIRIDTVNETGTTNDDFYEISIKY